jgi:selenocysteine lyase/cysteine desulfurase
MIYLNNAATSWPKPSEVAVATARAIERLPGAANRGGIEDFDVMDAVRARLAALMGVKDRSRIGLGANATWGLNLAIFGLKLGAGDHVVTTKAEHNSVLRPLRALDQRGVRIHYVETDMTGAVSLDSWRATLEKYKPRLAVFTHASNVTGAVNDVASLTSAAHEHDATVLLDLAQTLGWHEVALERGKVDLAAFTGHKYLLGPQGTGGLYVRRGLELEPHLVGGTGIRSDLDIMPDEMPLHLEAGTSNEPAAFGLLAALDWAAENPVSACRATVFSELDYLRQELMKLGARVINSSASDLFCTPVVSFTFDDVSAHDIGEALLDSYDIIVRTGLHCSPRIFECLGVDPLVGTVRVSLSRFTTHAELETFVEALRDIVVSRKDWF